MLNAHNTQQQQSNAKQRINEFMDFLDSFRKRSDKEKQTKQTSKSEAEIMEIVVHKSDNYEADEAKTKARSDGSSRQLTSSRGGLIITMLSIIGAISICYYSLPIFEKTIANASRRGIKMHFGAGWSFFSSGYDGVETAAQSKSHDQWMQVIDEEDTGNHHYFNDLYLFGREKFMDGKSVIGLLRKESTESWKYGKYVPGPLLITCKNGKETVGDYDGKKWNEGTVLKREGGEMYQQLECKETDKWKEITPEDFEREKSRIITEFLEKVRNEIDG